MNITGLLRGDLTRQHFRQLPPQSRAGRTPPPRKDTTKMNSGEPVNLLDRPKPPELSVNGAELSVNGSSPHIDDQPPEPPADPDGDPMKDYYVEMKVETGGSRYGWAAGRCADAELIQGELYLCVRVEAPNRAEALSKALTAAGTVLHDAATAVLNWENTLTKQSIADVEQFLDSRPVRRLLYSGEVQVDPWPWKWLAGKDDRIWNVGVGVHPPGLDEAVG